MIRGRGFNLSSSQGQYLWQKLHNWMSECKDWPVAGSVQAVVRVSVDCGGQLDTDGEW